MHRSYPAACAIAGAALASTAACASQTRLADESLEVERVVMYQSGVAYVERRGEVDGDEIILSVPPDQINDVLGSLVVVDRTRGEAAHVSFPSRPPRGGQGDRDLASLLDRLRGAHVQIDHEDGRAQGRIAAVDAGAERVTLVDEGETLSPIEIAAIHELTVENEALALELDRELDRASSEADWQPVELTLRFEGDVEDRELAVGWIVESPLWKPVYRLLVSEDEDDLHLQGFAIVDNRSGGDWREIDLELAAGAPVAFRYDLHAPLEIERVDATGHALSHAAGIEPPEPLDARPAPEPEPDVRDAEEAAPTRSRRQRAAGRADDDAPAGRAEPAPIDAEELVSPDRDEAEVERTGALYHQRIATPVTVADGASAMVTTVDRPVPGDDALVFRPEEGHEAHPHRSVLLENDMDRPVQSAPVAIYRDGQFVGRALGQSIDPGEYGFYSYALDRAVSVDVRRPRFEPGEAELEGTTSDGFRVLREILAEYRYDVARAGEGEEALYIAVPRDDVPRAARRAGVRRLELDVDDDVEVRTHAEAYLVRAEIPTGEHTVEVPKRGTARARIDLDDDELFELLEVWLERYGGAPAEIREGLADLRDEAARLREIESRREEEGEVRDELERSASRLRENLESLEREAAPELHAELTGRLAEVETEVAEVSASLVALAEEAAQRRAAMRAHFDALGDIPPPDERDW